MFKTVFLILLLAHTLGDFYFQTDYLAKEKTKSFTKVIVHCLVYALLCFIVTLPALNIWLTIGATLASCLHASVDSIKYYCIQRCKGRHSAERDRTIYAVDQCLHILSLGVASSVVTMNTSSLHILPTFDAAFEMIGISPYLALSWTLALLIIWKPTNITIKKLLSSYKPLEEGNSSESEKRTGGFIGLLERLIMIVLLSIDQYSAIGLVLTAKSIARYNKISQDKEFAEYYLLGTLLSTAMVIILSLLIL